MTTSDRIIEPVSLVFMPSGTTREDQTGGPGYDLRDDKLRAATERVTGALEIGTPIVIVVPEACFSCDYGGAVFEGGSSEEITPYSRIRKALRGSTTQLFITSDCHEIEQPSLTKVIQNVSFSTRGQVGLNVRDRLVEATSPREVFDSFLWFMATQGPEETTKFFDVFRPYL